MLKSCERNALPNKKDHNPSNTVLFNIRSMNEHPSEKTKCVASFTNIYQCINVPTKSKSVQDCVSSKRAICRSCRALLGGPSKKLHSFHVEVHQTTGHLFYENLKYKDGPGKLKDIGRKCNPWAIRITWKAIDSFLCSNFLLHYFSNIPFVYCLFDKYFSRQMMLINTAF